jgi:hypothetical protein
VEADAVSDTAGNNFQIPMKVSPAARAAGSTSLIQGPHERCGRLEPYLRINFFAGNSAGVSMFRPVL